MSERLIRTSYVDPTVDPPEPRQGDTGLQESRKDQEGYFGPLHRMHGAALHSWGVAAGLSIDATIGQAGVRVGSGVALDARGRLIPLAVSGHAGLDDGTLVTVDQHGVVLSTQGMNGGQYVTIAWAETFDLTGVVSGVFNTETTPMLRLRAPGQFPDDGTEIILAEVQLDAAGRVTALTAERRRVIGSSPDRIALTRTNVARSGALAVVSEAPAAELRALRDGGLGFNLLDALGTDRSALSIDGTSGNVGVGEVAEGQARRALHVEGGTEVHSGGRGGGFSFADRTSSAGAYVDAPQAGERWVWYAQEGQARLQSGEDLITVGKGGNGDALDVSRRMRVRQGSDQSAGIWFHQNVGSGSDRAFAGMANDDHVGFWGNQGALWGLLMNTSSGKVRVGSSAPPEQTLDVAGVAVVSDQVGIGTTTPQATLDVQGRTVLEGGSALAIFNRAALTVTAKPEQIGFPPRPISPDAARFNGDVDVIGKLTKSNLFFKIDHPLDPAGRYLSHSTVESDEMKNVYDGEVVLDERGEAEITLPDWFEALNERFRYQLTPLGRPAPDLHVSRKLSGNRFSVSGGAPGSEVCWLVTGIRHDPYALAHPLIVETEKEGEEHGRYRHPEPHGAPPDLAIGRGAATARREAADDADLPSGGRATGLQDPPAGSPG
ncbi:hypothetical protein [Streptomyces lydicus]|uniref:hypothetical protein n=1 Tax=Streptomyces lydicus TaxID=47763 RepID=UPI0037961F3A